MIGGRWMNNLAVKEVSFNGDILMAAQDRTTEKVYVGVSWICNGIGLNKNQKDRQVKNVQEDLVLKQGCVKYDAGVFDANNETICIELNFLPLWLAKISITPTMQKDSPDAVSKLVEYQIKAKDVLANAFIHNVTQIVPQTYKEALVALIDAIDEKEKLEVENQILLPKAESFDTFIDGSNVQKMNDVAKSLGYGRNKLYEFLRNNKILMKDNLPYQKYVNNYFVVKETPIKKGTFVINRPQTYVTARGVDFINKLINQKSLKVM